MLITIHQKTASYHPSKPNFFHWDLRANAADEDPLIESYNMVFASAQEAVDDAMKFLRIMASADLSKTEVKYGD